MENNLRRLFVGVEHKVPLLDNTMVRAINFDNAATTPPFGAVMHEIHHFAPWYASVHRSSGYKSLLSTEMYENGREYIKAFVGADRRLDTLIYVKNTTEAINVFAHVFAAREPSSVILSTEMEHLANDLPWRDKFAVDYVCVDKLGRLDLENLIYKLKYYKGKVKLVTVTGASNVTGYCNPIYEIARIAHRYGAEIFLDGAQLVPHKSLDMKPHDCEEHIDYVVFSAHKMYAPFGVGVLIGKRHTFCEPYPFLKGGGAVKLVTHHFVDWDDSPYKEEAGTPNVIGVAALLCAIKMMKKIDVDVVHEQEQEVIEYIIDGLRKINDICLYGCPHKKLDKVSIIAFRLPPMNHHLIAKILSCEYGISVRSGLFCAHPYVQKLMGMTKKQILYYRENPSLDFPGLVRVSLGIYNTKQEAEVFLQAVTHIADMRDDYMKKYRNFAACEHAQENLYYNDCHRLP